MPTNSAESVRGPAHSVWRGKTPVLAPDDARRLLDGIDVTTPVGLRDRALIGLMVYSFARVGAALAMPIEDVFVQNRRLCVRLHEKGGKRHEMPCHHNLEEYLAAYINGCELLDDRKGPLFRTIGRGTNQLSESPLPQASAFQTMRRHAVAAEIETAIGNHSFRATGITAYLNNGGMLERAATMANHASTRTTPALRSPTWRRDAGRGGAGADLASIGPLKGYDGHPPPVPQFPWRGCLTLCAIPVSSSLAHHLGKAAGARVATGGGAAGGPAVVSHG